MVRIVFLLCSATGMFGLAGQTAQEVYIEQYKDIAIEEMHRTGIPASIKMAQAILESNAGRSYLAKKGNNHFGIKCGSQWSGSTVMRKDDDYKNGRLVPSCFRAYSNPEESFVAHSEFLRDPRKNYRYGFLFRLDATDYKAWAKGLKKAGYATNPKYPRLLIQLIERYNLQQFDLMDPIDPALMVQEETYSPSLQRVNDVEYIYARPGERPIEISMDFGVSPDKIVKYNERIHAPNQVLEAGARVFLQKKRRSYRGEKKYHYVKAGDDMFSIAQHYGLRLDKLLSKNKMSEGEEPAIGEQIRLRGLSWFESKPVLRSEQESILPDELEEDLPADEDVQALPQAETGDEAEQPDAKEEEESPEVAVDTSTSTVEVDSPEVALTDVEKRPAEMESGLVESREKASAVETVAEYYEVKKGDTLYSISRRFALSVEKLKAQNELESNALRIGQQLRVR
jgi:LysM repeat protein